MTDLRQRLVEARLASQYSDNDGTGYNDEAANAALAVFVDWLRDEAEQVRNRHRSGPSHAINRDADDVARAYERIADKIG